MRFHHLFIEKFRGLEKVKLQFDSTHQYGTTSLRFLVGSNGTGKSTVLAAIGQIFSHFYANVSPGFGFELEYELEGQEILLSTRPLKRGGVKATPLEPVGVSILKRPLKPQGEIETKWSAVATWDSGGTGILPKLVVGYATGPSASLQWALGRSVEGRIRNQVADAEDAAALAVRDVPEMDRATVAAEQVALRENLKETLERHLDEPRALYLNNEDAQCAAATLLLFDGAGDDSWNQYAKKRRALLRKIGLDKDRPLGAFSVLVAGDWEQRVTHTRAETLRAFLMQTTVRTAIDRDPQSEQPTIRRDFYAVLDLGRRPAPPALDAGPLSPFRFFQELLAWKRQGAIREVRLALRKVGVQGLISASSLSDGEYLVLGRYALLAMLSDIQHALILLDEPETHYNDRWKVDLIQDLLEIMKPADSEQPDNNAANRSDSGVEPTSEILVATHSAITLSDAFQSQVLVFYRDRRNRVLVSRPTEKVFGGDIDYISGLLAQQDSTVGRYARAWVGQNLERAGHDPAAIRKLLADVGPGALQLRIVDALIEAEPDDSDVVKPELDD